VRWLPAGRVAAGAGGGGLVLFLDNVRRGEYESLRSLGFQVGLLADVASASRCAIPATLDVVAPWLPDEDDGGLVSTTADLSAKRPIAGILNFREAYVEAYARLAERLGFPALPPHLVGTALSKPRMRQRFLGRIGPDATANVADVRSTAHVHEFAQKFGYPVVIKPSELYSSLFVAKIEHGRQTANTLTRMRDAFDRYADAKEIPPCGRRLQVEEYLAGSNHSIDCLVDKWGNVSTTPVVDVITGQEIGLPDFHHFARFAPGRVTASVQSAMDKLAQAGVRALGLHSTGGPRGVHPH
jgi:biotin carboxylase